MARPDAALSKVRAGHYPEAMRIGDRAEYLAFRAVVGGLQKAPDQWSERLCRDLARLAGPVLGIRRSVVRDQLAAVYPELGDELPALVDRVYDHLGRLAAETFCLDPGKLAAGVTVEPGWESLDAAVAAGRGVLAVTAHLGSFELGGRILAGRYPVLDVVKPMRNRVFDEYLQRMRGRHGIRTVSMDGSGRPVLSHLRAGGLVTLLIDQDAGRDGVRTDFLGLPASTWPGAARLALRTGCPVVPLAILRQDGGGHILRIGDVIAPPRESAAPEDIKTFTGRISAAVEAFIHEHPEQWFWVHRRWKGAAEAETRHEESSSRKFQVP